MKATQVVLLLVCGVFTAGVASAQDQEGDKGRVGLAMGFPTSVALVWHATDAIAIRPEISFTGATSDTTTGTVTTTTTRTTGWNTNLGVGMMFYGEAKDNLRVYFSPRLIYMRQTSKTTTTTATSQSTISGYGASGAVGGQYALGRRFSAYGEVGLQYSHGSTTTVGSTTTTKSNTVGVRSAAGVILYF